MLKAINNQLISDMEDDTLDNSLLEPALAVHEEADVDDHDVSNNDASAPPTSGNEYLRRVRQEAQKCPKVVVAKIDTSMFKQQQTVKYQHKDTMAAPNGYGPTAEWVKMQVADFVTIRQKIVRFKALLAKKELSLPEVKLPLAGDMENWCRLCFGRLRLKTGQAEQSADEVDNGNKGTPPLLSVVARMDQTIMMTVLEYHVNWLEATGFTHRQGQWFYALLANLQKPLTPELCSSLRQLAKLCSIIRYSLKSPEDSILLELNLLICLVAHYFDQGDMADKT